jgi:hypothetical protein
MKNKLLFSIYATLFLATAGATTAHQGHGIHTFDHISAHYEKVRLALAEDTLQGVPLEAQAIHNAIEALRTNFAAEAAGVEAAKAEKVRELLPELAKAALSLSTATDLEAARDAFYSVSKPLVRYRSVVDGHRPAVAYCPMARRSWLQPEGEIGNPYYGQAMLTCGDLVER